MYVCVHCYYDYYLIQVTIIGAGTIFQLGKQKLNDFSASEAKTGKNNQDKQIQSITLCNMYFSKKKYTQCTMGSGYFQP